MTRPQGGVNLEMDKKSKIPLYLQLMEELIKKIEKQDYQEHTKLPSERELCEIYSLSRITIRQALQELEHEGYIYKQHGIGTFVAPKLYNQKLAQLYTFTEEMEKLGKAPSTKVLSFEKMAIDERLAMKMGLKPLDGVYKIVRLRLADEMPLMYETSYIPSEVFPNLSKAQMQEKPMYDIFYEDYQIELTRATERFSATLTRKEEAENLAIAINQPAMLIKRYAYYNDALIEYTNSVARGDKFAYTVDLT